MDTHLLTNGWRPRKPLQGESPRTNYYQQVKSNLLRRRQTALLHHYLGLENELREIEYGLHYVEEQLHKLKVLARGNMPVSNDP